MSGLYTWQLRDLIACSEQELQSLVPLVEEIVNLADTARHEGLLALDDVVDRLADPLLALGLRLAVDGVDPDQIRSILEIRILTSMHRGVQLVKDLIILEGTLCIFSGVSPLLVIDKLASFLGPASYQVAKEVNARLTKVQDGRIKKLIGTLIDQDLPPRSPATSLIEPLVNFGDLAIQKLLRELDTQVLAQALKGSGSGPRRAVLRNLTKYAVVCLVEEMQDSEDVGETRIVEAQETLMAVLRRLIDMGEISEKV